MSRNQLHSQTFALFEFVSCISYR